ncbi:hypothetical protein F5Y10DRAFT_257808 [Nemania abortiva]|nr:hypothetical protein F5Y10DRAFT_257808 [Nemania abortiva]
MIDQANSAYWRPPWLRKPVLFAFCALFILFSVGLVLLWYLVNRYDGIPLTLTTNHYAWTYGPTAIFTVVLSLWRQVNYCTMVNQPWYELHRDPQDATKTVLLDYIWPFQGTSFAVALKNRHLAVATTILNFALLKLVMIISTTLFVLGGRSSSQDVRARLLTKFDTTNYLNSTKPGNHYIVTSDPAWDYLDLREEYPDAAPPLELSTAFTNYSISSQLPGGADKASVQVDVFQVNATCENTTIDLSQNGPAKSFNLTLSTPSCDIGRIEVLACSSQNAAFCGSGARYFQSGLVGCTGQGYADVNLDDIRAATDEYRLAIVTIESDLTRTSEPETFPADFNVDVRRIAAVSCALEYSINQGIAYGPAFDTNKVDSLEIMDEPQGQIHNLTGLDILDAIIISASNASATNTSYSITLMYNGYLDLLGLLTDSRSITPTTFDPLLNVSSLRSRAEETLTGLSHQLMRRYFFSPDDTATSGSIDYTEQRLYTRAAALWAMVGLLAIISCLVIVVVVYSKQGVAPRSPATLATAAYTTARSPAMSKLLEESGAIRLSEIRNTLANYDFIAVRDLAGMPRVEAVATTREKALPKPPSWLSRKWKSISWKSSKQPQKSKPKKKRPWMPYSSHSHAIALTLILPTTAIAVLEILWYFSEHNEHFVAISSDSSVAAYAIRYSSTAIVLVISTLFNTLDFAIATMTSFSALATGDATAERTLLFAITGDLPPVAFYKTIYHMHVGAALSLVASTIGSLLTIAVSGLWVDTTVQISRDVTVEVQSDWNVRFTENNINFDSGTIVGTDTITVFNDVEHGFPDKATLIWGNVVLPRVGNPQPLIASQFKESLNGGNAEYNIAVPAVKPFLECSKLPPSAIFTSSRPTIFADGPGPPTRTVGATITLPTGCVDAYESGEQAKTIGLSYDFYDNTTSGWIGQLYDLSVIFSSERPPSNGCPSLAVVFGTYEGLDQLQSNITVLTCTQHLQSVEANATYPGDSSAFTPNLTTAVRLNPPPPRNIVDAQSGGSSLGTKVGDGFRYLELIEPIDDTTKFDPFFSRVVNGPGGTSRENLLGSENVDSLIAAVNNLYQRFMVRVVDLEWRSSIGGENTTQPVANSGVARGSIIVPVSRLKLNEASKIVLQAFLGTMVVLGGIAWWCVDMRVLPRNPYPIASSMALFAGSRLIGASSQAPSGDREQEYQRQIKRKPLVIVKGKRFRLGWWEGSNAAATDNGNDSDSASQSLLSTEGRRFGIDVEDKDKAVSSTASKISMANLRRRWLNR